MARSMFANITAKGVKSQFNEALANYPSVWQNHCTTVDSDAPDEDHAWLGMIPKPREFVSSRNIQGLNDFKWNVANKEYELSFIIDQNSIEDDRTGDINRQITSIADVWASYKDEQFATLLESGDAAGFVDFTGSVFFNSTHTAIGASGAFDNDLTRNIGTTTCPTVAEMRLIVSDFLAAFHSYYDDQGRLGYNGAAMNDVRVVGHPQYEPVAKELSAGTAVAIGGDGNAFFKGAFSFDPLPFLTATDVTLYCSLVGAAARRPLIYQDRTPLNITVINDNDSVQENHGVMVLCRQRYRMTYGEPRRCAQNIMT